MKAILCEYLRNTCAHRRKEKTWIPIELAKVYKKRKVIKYVLIDGVPRTKIIKIP